jgi:hypothetical protein
MDAILQFGDVLEAVDALTLDEQETVVRCFAPAHSRALAGRIGERR